MAEARERSEWARMSALLALTANAHRDPKKSRPFKPGDFDPFASASKTETVNDKEALKALFMKKDEAGRHEAIGTRHEENARIQNPNA